MKNMRKIIIILAALFLNLIPALCLAAFTYEPMEEIPGFGRPSDFPSYVVSIYKFGLWAVGLSAMLMISIGGYMYLTSGGNTSQTGKAKEIITDSIVGILLAMTSWLILYIINSDLVKTPLTSEELSSRTESSAASNNTSGVCICYDGSWVPFYYPEVGESINASTREACRSECESRSSKYYSFSGDGNDNYRLVNSK